MKTASRIIEAMVRLVLRQGYDKTTMQDIADEAGVARSTIYTKWKTKEALFTDVLWVESLAYLDDWLELVEQDADDGSLRSIYRTALHAVRQRPFILALYTQNQFVLGSFTHDPTFAEAISALLLWNTNWLRTLQAHGLIRINVDVETIAWIEVIFRQGFYTLPINLAAHPNVDYEAILAQFFTMVEQFVGTQESVSPDRGKTALRDYIDTIKSQQAPSASE